MQTHDFLLVGCDTDGIAFKKRDQKPWTEEERTNMLAELNSYMEGHIQWDEDGVVKKQLVIRTKNYALQEDDGSVKIKGSGLKGTTKEKALQRFIREVIDLLLADKKDQLLFLYLRYAKEIMSLNDMAEWSSKKTITKAVLTNTRTNEKRVREALAGRAVQEGDKVYMFFKTDTELCLAENFDGTYCADTLLEKLFKTLSIFDTVLDVDMCPNFSLRRNRELLNEIFKAN